MKISKNIPKYPSFGRALTTKEKQAYKKLTNIVANSLGIKDTNAIIFDFSVPSSKNKNTGIGTTWSKTMSKFVHFLKDMMGINSIQLAPQGKISSGNISPYSGTTYAYGHHLIDLSKLSKKEYGCLLPKDIVTNIDKKYKGDLKAREYKTDYDYVLGNDNKEGVQITALKMAFKNYKNGIDKKMPEIIQLESEFLKFKQENANWLEKEVVFSALSYLNGTQDFNRWKNESDKNLYNEAFVNKETREKRINELRTDKKTSEIIEFEEFVQFIADKQQKESHKLFREEDIKIYGDCLLGFSQGEMWANPECFKPNLFFGGPDPNCPETNYIQTWRLPALDYTKIGKCDSYDDVSNLEVSGKLLYDKFSKFFERYDAIRIDAAWQYITPFLYKEENGTFSPIELPEIDVTVFNIMKAAQKRVKNKVDDDNIMLELVGITAQKSQQKTFNKYPHLYTTEYAEYNENPKKFIEKGYNPQKFYVGTGNHDSNSLVGLSKDSNKRLKHTKDIIENYKIDMKKTAYKDEGYNSQSDDEKLKENFRNVKLAEVFSTAKHFFTLNDMFGYEERINYSGKISKSNWTSRVPTDYEKFYYSQLSKGYGINLPKIFSLALQMQQKSNQYIVKKCDELAEILRAKGPLTEEEANNAQKNGELKDIFTF